MDRSRLLRAAGSAAAPLPPVVVLNTHYSGLAIARDLAPLGIRVVGVTANKRFAGNRSRCMQWQLAPDSFDAPDRLLPFLLNLSAALGDRPVLFPTRDHDVQFINAHRESLEAVFRIPSSPPSVIERIMNKERCRDAARRCAIRVPAAVTLLSLDDLPRAKVLRFPCVCKPLFASQWRNPRIWQAVGRRKAIAVESYSELQQAYATFGSLDPLVTIEEQVAGPEQNLQIFGAVTRRDATVAAFFTARKLLQYPPQLGTGVVVEATPLPAIIEPGIRLLRELEHYGLSEIEFKIDERDGQPYLIEVNPRHWDQHGLGTAVGVNLSEVAYRLAAGLEERTMQQRDEPVRWIADTDFALHLVRCLVGKASLTQALSMARGKRQFAIFDRSDLAPSVAALKTIASTLLSSAKAKLPAWLTSAQRARR